MPRKKWTVHGRLFQARMWREYAMAIKYDRPSMLSGVGIGRDWCLIVGRMTYEGCIRQSRVNSYLARRLNRGSQRP